MDYSKEFEECAGTYVKVVRFAEPMNPDGFIVLYLRPGGKFLFLGYWRATNDPLRRAIGRSGKRTSSFVGEGALIPTLLPATKEIS